MDQANVKQKPGLRDYWQIFLRRKWLIILPIVIIAPIGILVPYLKEPIYQASATLITEELERTSIVRDVGRIPVPETERLDTIRLKIQSRRYMNEVSDKVGVDKYLRSIGESTEPDDIVKYLRKIVRVRPMGGRLVMITVTHPIPEMARDIADAVADGYINKALIGRQSIAEETLEFIEEQMEFYWKRLSGLEEQLAEAQRKSPLGYLSDEASSIVSEAAKLKTDLFGIELDLREAKAEFQKAREFSDSSTIETALRLDPEIASLQAKLSGLQERHAELSEKYSDYYPELRKVKADMVKAQEALDKARERFMAQQQDSPERLRYWEDRIENLESKKTAINDKIAEYDRKLQTLPERELEIARLQREKSIAEGTYSMLMERKNTLELMSTSELQNMGMKPDVMDYAFLPDSPISPNRKRSIIMGIGMGIALGVGSTFLLEYFNRSFRSVDEVLADLGIPVLATIPRLTTRESIIREKRLRYVKIGCIGSVALLVLIVATDVLSAELLARDSFSLDIARAGIGFLKEQLKYKP